MVEAHKHEFEWKRATKENPYHFVDSGLTNAYLSGIRYQVCTVCGFQSAEIPALKELMIVLARAVVKKAAPLNGAEIRFLRKRLGKKSSEFGRIIGVSDEQVSRWENDKNSPEESADKLIRVFYCELSRDKALREQLDKNLESWLATLPREDGEASLKARLKRDEWITEPATC